MKILIVDGDDYGALNFKNVYSGTKVSDILKNIDDFAPKDGDDFWDLTTQEVEGDIPSKEFIKFAKFNIDYDNSKHKMWYCETETI